MNRYRAITVVLMVLTVMSLAAYAQKPKPAPAYKLTGVKVVPFNEQTGKFEDELTAKSDRSFFNDLSISLFVAFEVSGQAGSYESGRNLVINITEGKKLKLAKVAQIGLIGSDGKYYVPVFLYSSMCSNVNITAKIAGQRVVSSISRKVAFLCGE